MAYAGLDASVRASGLFEGTRNRMSKRGSPLLRNSLLLAAVSARRFNPELRTYYDLNEARESIQALLPEMLPEDLFL